MQTHSPPACIPVSIFQSSRPSTSPTLKKTSSDCLPSTPPQENISKSLCEAAVIPRASPCRPGLSYKDALNQDSRPLPENLRIKFSPNFNGQATSAVHSSNSLTEAGFQRIRDPWKQALIVKTFGRSLGFKFFNQKIREIWKPQGHLEIIDLGRDFFITRFSDHSDFCRVLTGGPWFINSFFLTIRLWEPNFNPEEAKTSSAAVWVRLPTSPSNTMICRYS